MGELFDRTRPVTPLGWTGERLTTDAFGQVEIEHLHRYFLARHLCRGMDVLDIASGEGYGSALLAQTARSVIAIELNQSAVEHAAHSYQRDNLSYKKGDARQIDLPDSSMDCVISFETIEHFYEHEQFCAEVHRVLRPDGIFVVSSPDKDIYSPANGPTNPYHVKELTKGEFHKLLSKYFATICMMAQRAMIGSVIVADHRPGTPTETLTFERRVDDRFEVSHGLSRSQYVIAVCSNGEHAPSMTSIYCEKADIDGALSLPSMLQSLQAMRRDVDAAQAEAQAHSASVAQSQASERQAREAQSSLEMELQSRAVSMEELRRLVRQLDEENSRMRDAHQADRELQVHHVATLGREVSTLGAVIVAAEAAHRDHQLATRDAYETEQARLHGQVLAASEAAAEAEALLGRLRDDHHEALRARDAAHFLEVAETRQLHEIAAKQMTVALEARDALIDTLRSEVALHHDLLAVAQQDLGRADRAEGTAHESEVAQLTNANHRLEADLAARERDVDALNAAGIRLTADLASIRKPLLSQVKALVNSRLKPK